MPRNETKENKITFGGLVEKRQIFCLYTRIKMIGVLKPWILFTNCELCQEHIFHDRLLDLEEKREEIVHFELKDDQQL